MSGYADRSVAVRGGLKKAGQPFLETAIVQQSTRQREIVARSL